MDTAILIAGLVALAAANTIWWWYVGRDQLAKTRRLRKLLRSSGDRSARWAERAVDAEAEVVSLRERNEMLTGLVAPERRPS